MTPDAAYTALVEHARQTEALDQVAGLLSWDQEAMMPPKGAEARAEQAGAMSTVLHARRTDPQIPDWLAAIDEAALDASARANVRLIRRSHARAVKVPGSLSAEMARTTARAHGIWAEARERRDVALFLPTLARIVDLSRERAACLSGPDARPYDALLDLFEPGTDTASIAATFARLRAGLVDLRARIAERSGDRPALRGTFPRAAQMALAHKLASTFGYDPEAGRIDLVIHPFCSGTRGDVRITTRIDERDPLNCLYSTIHETGHALYEQGLDPDLAWQPAGQHASMGVHESQSRLCENQIGRSRAFAEYLDPHMRDAFSDYGLDSADALHAAVNRVESGFIRTEADEVHYNLHIMLRFELEQALISGDLPVVDLEAAWNDWFEADFGCPVTDPANGVLQDVHWSAGLFGYFPTYSLGNIYAAELFTAMRAALPDLDEAIGRGDLSDAVAWLRTHVHRPGATLDAPEIIAAATGHPPSEGPLLDYLNRKFSELYDL